MAVAGSASGESQNADATPRVRAAERPEQRGPDRQQREVDAGRAAG